MINTKELRQSQMQQESVFDNAFNRALPKRRRRIREEERIFNNVAEDNKQEGSQMALFELDSGVETKILQNTDPGYVTVGRGLAGELSTTVKNEGPDTEKQGIETKGYEGSNSEGGESVGK
jgi:hypothetical protein